MLLTEEQAKEKWCPFVRTVKFSPSVSGGIAIMQAIALGNRLAENSDELPGVTRCIGSACMAWRWVAVENPHVHPMLATTEQRYVASETHGFCGLAGGVTP